MAKWQASPSNPTYPMLCPLEETSSLRTKISKPAEPSIPRTGSKSSTSGLLGIISRKTPSSHFQSLILQTMNSDEGRDSTIEFKVHPASCKREPHPSMIVSLNWCCNEFLSNYCVINSTSQLDRLLSSNRIHGTWQD